MTAINKINVLGSHFHLSLNVKASFERFGRYMELRISM